MNSADVRRYAAEQGSAEDEAPGMEAKSKEFVEKAAEVYAMVCVMPASTDLGDELDKLSLLENAPCELIRL